MNGFSQMNHFNNSYFGLGLTMFQSPLISSYMFNDLQKRIEVSVNSSLDYQYEMAETQFKDVGAICFDYAFRWKSRSRWVLNTEFIYGLNNSGSIKYKGVSTGFLYSLEYKYKFLRNELGLSYIFHENSFLNILGGVSLFGNFYFVDYDGYTLKDLRNRGDYYAIRTYSEDEAHVIGFGPSLKILFHYKGVGIISGITYQAFKHVYIIEKSNIFTFEQFIKKKDLVINIVLVRL
ncbi:MAG: hypothetical protein Kow00108_02210 [Calditrichia bacterium]